MVYCSERIQLKSAQWKAGGAQPRGSASWQALILHGVAHGCASFWNDVWPSVQSVANQRSSLNPLWPRFLSRVCHVSIPMTDLSYSDSNTPSLTAPIKLIKSGPRLQTYKNILIRQNTARAQRSSPRSQTKGQPWRLVFMERARFEKPKPDELILSCTSYRMVDEKVISLKFYSSSFLEVIEAVVGLTAIRDLPVGETIVLHVLFV